MASTSAAAANVNLQNQESFYGWDLLYRTISPIINKKSDILIALVHFLLTKNSNFRCLGIGEDKTLSDDEIGSELLPDNWNDDDIKYALRYSFNNQLYLLLGHITEDCIIINLLDVKTKKVSNIGLEPENLVQATSGPITTMIPTVMELTSRYRRELIDPVFQGTKREVTTQTTTASERADPLRISEPIRPIGQFIPMGVEPRPFGFPDVGRGDLDPLGRGGPGNLFQLPNRPDFGEIPRPRFDPYGPPDRNVRPNPNPDHLQPPNFGGHDYFM